MEISKAQTLLSLVKNFKFPFVLFLVLGFSQIVGFSCRGQNINKENTNTRVQLEQETDSLDMARNILYNEILDDYERLSAIYLQQPGNTLALRKYGLDLKAKVEQLGSLNIAKSKGRTEISTTDTSSKGKVSTPNGPVKPTDRPSSPEDKQRQIEATSKFYGHPISQSKPAHSLTTVPKIWITQSMNNASVHLQTLCSEFEKDTPNTNLIQDTLKALGTTLYKTSTPPPNVNKTDPKK